MPSNGDNAQIIQELDKALVNLQKIQIQEDKAKQQSTYLDEESSSSQNQPNAFIKFQKGCSKAFNRIKKTLPILIEMVIKATPLALYFSVGWVAYHATLKIEKAIGAPFDKIGSITRNGKNILEWTKEKIDIAQAQGQQVDKQTQQENSNNKAEFLTPAANAQNSAPIKITNNTNKTIKILDVLYPSQDYDEDRSPEQFIKMQIAPQKSIEKAIIRNKQSAGNIEFILGFVDEKGLTDFTNTDILILNATTNSSLKYESKNNFIAEKKNDLKNNLSDVTISAGPQKPCDSETIVPPLTQNNNSPKNQDEKDKQATQILEKTTSDPPRELTEEMIEKIVKKTVKETIKEVLPLLPQDYNDKNTTTNIYQDKVEISGEIESLQNITYS